MKTYKKYTAILLTTLCALWGCQSEPSELPLPQVAAGIKVQLEIPGIYTPVTRALSEAAENTLEQIDVLVFTDGGSGQQFAYRIDGANIVNSGSAQDGFTASFNVPVATPVSANLLIVANARALVDQLTLTPGDSKVSVLQSLVYQHGLWDTGSPMSIPMLGETGIVSLTPGSTVSGVKMTRMLVRIDVDVAAPDFTLQNVYLYNYNTRGYVSPGWDAQGNVDSSPAVRPNLPDPTGKAVGQALTYNVAGATNLDRTIYTFEAAVAPDLTPAALLNATCLVLEGIFQGRTYFYRVDFTDQDGEYNHLLRNYIYEMTVTEAKGIGYDTREEALASYGVPSNLNTRLISYDLGQVRYVVFNGQNMLGAGNAEIIYPWNEIVSPTQEQKVPVFTDYGGGWEISGISDASGNPVNWLHADLTQGPANLISHIGLTMTTNYTPADRRAFIMLKAGRLRQQVVIQQDRYPVASDILPNCYIVAPGATQEIPVIKAWKVWSELFSTILPEQNITTELLWQDRLNAIAAPQLNFKRVESTISVTAGPSPGNAVVVVKVDGVIRWSWHIWVGSDMGPYNGTVWMDRNLGATSAAIGTNTATLNDASGLLYAWGRKDPFPGRRNVWFDAQGNSNPTIPVISSATTVNSIMNPFSWMGASWNPIQNSWGGLSGRGIYNPCPTGWKLPQIDGWSALNTTTFPTVPAVSSTGRFNADVGGYYPYTGSRQTAGLVNTGIGYYWSGSPSSGGNNRYLLLSQTGVTSSNTFSTSNGLAVRCIQE